MGGGGCPCSSTEIQNNILMAIHLEVEKFILFELLFCRWTCRTRRNCKYKWKKHNCQKFCFQIFIFKDIRMTIFNNTDFLHIFVKSDNELPISEMQKNWGLLLCFQNIKGTSKITLILTNWSS